jgi:hypothetical protein
MLSRCEKTRHLIGIIIFMGMVFCAGCPRGPRAPKEAAVVTPQPPPQGLATGQSFVFEFPADGDWHASDYVAVNGSLLAFEPLGPAAGLSPQALRIRIGQVPQMLRSKEVFKITMPGPIEFKVIPRYANGFKANATVEVKRLLENQ